MEIKRRHLGTVYTKSPAQLVEKILVDNTSKILFAIFISILWLAIFYVFIGVIRFVGGNVGDIESWKDATTLEIFNHPYALPVKVIGIVLIWLYVFRDNISNR